MSTAHDQILSELERQIIFRAVGQNHAYRKLNRLIDFEALSSPLKNLYSHLGQPGIPVVRGFKAMLLQFWEDLSDREMERAVCENLAIRWFCGFNLTDKTPDHTFIDASTIVTKSALWKERDKAIKDGHDKLNNLIVRDYAADKDARWGAKSKKNIWFGYKRHTAVDMRHGLISKTAVTPANVPDFKVVNRICPDQGYIFLDKLYDTKTTDRVIKGSGCSPGTIRKNNNPNKNFDLDRWRSRVRMPFEGTFACLAKQARYRGLSDRGY